MDKEIWKPVTGYEGYYEISNMGRLRSLNREVVRSDGVLHSYKGIIITLIPNTDGYLQAKLCVGGVYKTIRVHRLVAEHFIPNPNKLPEVNHIDCNRQNNKVENLEWTDHISNVQYSSALGHYKHFGERNPNYQNDTLKKFYTEHPEKALELLRRPGAQNGRAVSIKAFFPDGKEEVFSYIGECAEALIERGYTKSKVNSIRTRIREDMKLGKKYKGIKFEKIEENTVPSSESNL